jgi:hypothetical protein
MAFGIDDAITGVSNLLTTAIDKIWPDPQDKAKAEAQIMLATAQSAIMQLEAANKAANAEASSSDPWTSRARPGALYVCYLFILFGIPIGILSVFNPDAALKIASGTKAWMGAIPDQLWGVFGVMFSVYAGGRTFEKVKGVAK